MPFLSPSQQRQSTEGQIILTEFLEQEVTSDVYTCIVQGETWMTRADNSQQQTTGPRHRPSKHTDLTRPAVYSSTMRFGRVVVDPC